MHLRIDGRTVYNLNTRGGTLIPVSRPQDFPVGDIGGWHTYAVDIYRLEGHWYFTRSIDGVDTDTFSTAELGYRADQVDAMLDAADGWDLAVCAQAEGPPAVGHFPDGYTGTCEMRVDWVKVTRPAT